MLIVIVYVHVKERDVDAFSKISIENASHSCQEEGVSFFDVLQENDDPTKFVLLEVYKDEVAAKAHKETVHYQKWKETVADMMVEPRQSVKYHEIYPSAEFWQKQR